MINDFFTKEDLPLFSTGTRFSLASLFFQEKMKDLPVTFDLLIREMPPSRNYFWFAGLEHAVDYLLNLRLNNKQLAWIKKSFSFRPDIMAYFRKLRFTGDLYAMQEGTIFFAQEPIMRITAPLIEAQIIEHFLVNNVFLQTNLASKIARLVDAAGQKETALGYNRSYGIETALKADRIKEILGVGGSSSLYNYKSGSTPFVVGTYHYLIKVFDKEIDAFRSYLKHMKGEGYILIDTYDSVQGIKRFIRAAKELAKTGHRAVGIQLDSGDLYRLSVTARKLFDQAGLTYCKIFAMSNLDEYKVAVLERKKAPIDVYGGTTAILTPLDAPTLEVVYKLSEITKDSKQLPKMKTSTAKVSLPGRKQVNRIKKGDHYSYDVIGLDNEKIAGSRKLLQPIIKNGKLVKQLPSLSAIGNYYRREKKLFNQQLFRVNKKYNYQVKISEQLRKLVNKTKKEINKQ